MSAIDERPDNDGMPCTTEGCKGRIEASVTLWLNLDADGRWSVYGVNDHEARIVCDFAEHDNRTEPLIKSLEAFLEELHPGSTWTGSEPPRGED